MGAFNDYLETQLVTHIFRTSSFPKPTTLAVALYTAMPGEAGGGTEVTGGSYARVTNNPLDANWAAPSAGNGTTSNTPVLTFPAPTANWGTVVGFALLDNTSGGNFLFYGPLVANKTINNGDAAPSFGGGALAVTLD